MNMLDRLISLRRRKTNSISSVGGCEQHKSEGMRRKRKRYAGISITCWVSVLRPHVQCLNEWAHARIHINRDVFLSHSHPICLVMSFVPCLCSTPKFVPVLHQPSHFVLAAPIRMKTDSQRPTTSTTSCRPLRKCHRYHSKQSNASTAINRQSYFATDSRRTGHQTAHVFFCLPWSLLQRSKRRRQRPCHV